MIGATHRFLVIMVKRAQAGRVKTRLGADIGLVHATRFYRHASRLLARRLGCDPRWTTVLAVAPDDAVADDFWPTELPRVAQGRGDLGARMQHVLNELPPGAVVIIGSDCPTLNNCDIALAFRALGAHDVVYAPAPDGGYGLIGFRRVPKIPQAFDNVRWSSKYALHDTLCNLNGLCAAALDPVADVDTGADYNTVGRATGRLVLPSSF